MKQTRKTENIYKENDNFFCGWRHICGEMSRMGQHFQSIAIENLSPAFQGQAESLRINSIAATP